MNDSKTKKFFDHLAKAATEGIRFTANTISTKDYQNTPPSLLMILGIDKKQLSNVALLAIEAIEEYEKTNKEWIQFK